MTVSAVRGLFRALKWEKPESPPAQIQGDKRHPTQACRWPGCDRAFSKMMGVGTKELVAVCPEHSRQFRKLDIVGYNHTDWQPKRAWQ